MGNDQLANKQAPLGSGMARQAANAMMSQPYRAHVQEAKALGQVPMTPQEFAAKHGG